MDEDRIDITTSFKLVAVSDDLPEKTSKMIAKDLDVKKKRALKLGEFDAIVSNSGIDRHGESIIMEGIDTKQVKRNPVVLWSHKYSELPIGKIVRLWKSQGNLMARIQMATDIYPFAQKIYEMVLKGFINAVSIGGIVKEWDQLEDGSRDWSKILRMEMIELSIVPVGAHPDALVTSKSFEKQEKEFIQKSTVNLILKVAGAVDKLAKEMSESFESLNEKLKAFNKGNKKFKLSTNPTEPKEARISKTVLTLGSKAEPKIRKTILKMAKQK